MLCKSDNYIFYKKRRNIFRRLMKTRKIWKRFNHSVHWTGCLTKTISSNLYLKCYKKDDLVIGALDHRLFYFNWQKLCNNWNVKLLLHFLLITTINLDQRFGESGGITCYQLILDKGLNLRKVLIRFDIEIFNLARVIIPLKADQLLNRVSERTVYTSVHHESQAISAKYCTPSNVLLIISGACN